ncbi:calcium-binding protein [Sphingomonas sp.]|uniref:calcium-binding protein n=1 Tax=Sphingomonas sp. TaxID=28214 RepID=UPI0025D98E45|nr:calcium-binding protein [Sphingomonas sp.]MBV9528412.1 calcium-binding protein [Sphingomonas sp.]
MSSSVYVSPTGAGDQSGSSAENAMPFSALNSAIQSAGPGGTVMMLADQGTYETTGTLQLSSGGADGAPVTIEGVDSLGNPMDVQIHGTRPAYTPGMTERGNQVFALGSGADNLVFQNMDFHDVSMAFHFAADLRNITIQDMQADNVRLFAGHWLADSYASATVSGLTVRNVEVHGFSYGVVTLRYDTNSVLIQNVYGDSQYEDKDGIAEGIHLCDTVHGVVIEDSTMLNSIHSSGTYYNGDGFATERGVYDVQFLNDVARGNGDGGFDLKSTSTVLVNPVAEDNARNFRLWGEIDLVNPSGIDPHKRGGGGGQFQIQLLDGAKVTVTGGWLVDSGSATSVVHAEGTTSISFADTHVIYAGSLDSSFGLDPTLVEPTIATGSYSTNAEIYIGGDVIPPPPLPVLTGTSGNDTLHATTNADWTVSGLAGNDTIVTLGGNDVIVGGAGNDVISAGAGDDVLRIQGTGQGFDKIDGGLGTDQVQALANGTVIGLASIAGVEAITANGFTGVTISGSGSADSLDFSGVTLTGINSINGGAGNDIIHGSAGDDVIAGGSGADTLYGGGGNDRFVVNSTGVSTTAAPDRIVDFTSGEDRIDVSGIDAISSTGGNQAFAFIGETAFSHVAGQLRVDTSDPARTVVQGDVNGDGVADFAVTLDGTHHLLATDLVL